MSVSIHKDTFIVERAKKDSTQMNEQISASWDRLYNIPNHTCLAGHNENSEHVYYDYYSNLKVYKIWHCKCFSRIAQGGREYLKTILE